MNNVLKLNISDYINLINTSLILIPNYQSNIIFKGFKISYLIIFIIN